TFLVEGNIRVDGSSRALQYETVQAVDNGPILRDMAFSPDHHHLYVMSETQPVHLHRDPRELLCILAAAEDGEGQPDVGGERVSLMLEERGSA
ncbi:hypothetical protein KUCAC02_006337, partial [Chaenocephalus aceratus]